MLARLGLQPTGGQRDEELLVAVFDFLKERQSIFEQFFHDWFGGAASRARALKSPEAHLYEGELFDRLMHAFAAFRPAEGTEEHLRNPYFSREKPTTLLIDEIEWIWDAIAKDDDWSRFEAKIHDIRDMGRAFSRRP